MEGKGGKNEEKWIKELKAPGMGTQHDLVVSGRTLREAQSLGSTPGLAPPSGQEEECNRTLGLPS